MSLKLFLCFTLFRIANVFLIQSQFDPDEYWQNLEPSYCYIFGDGTSFDKDSSCPGLTWEWKRRGSYGEITASSNSEEHWSSAVMHFFMFGFQGPVRSFASILPTLLFYWVIKTFGWDSPWMVARGPFVLNSILVAAATDWTVWYASKWMKSTINGHSNNDLKIDEMKNGLVFWCVYCQLSSWFNAYTLIRTYSNSLETLLLSVSLALVSPVGCKSRICWTIPN